MDHGIPEVQAAGLLALMGIFDLVGTTGSGWLSDRFDNRLLLLTYYGFRSLSLLYLPYGFMPGGHGLTIFAVFYGLDWIATVPPTVALTRTSEGNYDHAFMIAGGLCLISAVGVLFAGKRRAAPALNPQPG